MASLKLKEQHPGATREEIQSEPDWVGSHSHRIGFVNQDSRRPGFTHGGEEHDPEYEEKVEKELRRREQLQKDGKAGKLLNFQDVLKGQMHLQTIDPSRYPPTWRFVVDATEDWIKKEQPWPANIEAKKKKEEAAAKAEAKKQNEQGDDEHDWRRSAGREGDKHHDAYATAGEEGGEGGEAANKHQDEHRDSLKTNRGNDDKSEESDDEDEKSKVDVNQNENDKCGTASDSETAGNGNDKNDKPKTEYQKLREKYSPQEIALLRAVQSEQRYMQNIQASNGKIVSPAKEASMKRENNIDTQDQGTPDNWIPRSSDLVRMTGQHPLNAEPTMNALFAAGLITPNQLHYVRNHGSVPRLFWETHQLDIEKGSLILSMDDLANHFEAHNIAVALACDGNRRGELNMIKKSKGFSWGSSAISCSYWKGPLLRDVLLAAGIPEHVTPGQRPWVNFEGADDLAEGRYATSIPLEYAMDPANDVILAYEMNNLPLPADHGYPVRVIIPGYVGGRCVKWLKRIWLSDKENDSYYHVWDNRVLPSFVTEKDGVFAETLFNHPSTACNEQNLNSIIAKPAQGETMVWNYGDGNDHYRIEGIAYDGGGHEVQRVEVSLDEGETWLWCIRKFPDYPLRHGKNFWTWIHWHVDVEKAYLYRARSISVRCFNVFKNTQPKNGSWNIMGMMNNSWYTVKSTLQDDNKTLFWWHPFDIDDRGGGWMKPSTENQLAAAKQDSGVPDKQFTREEVEKHNNQDDCWIVVNNNVYDATSILKWHPGGASSILAYAGRLTRETTDNFESIHDDYAHKKLNECVLGRLTEKAANYIKAVANSEAKSLTKDKTVLLQKNHWTTVTLKSRKQLSEDTYAYIFQMRKGFKKLGLDTCQHLQIGIHMKDKMLIRSYTPTRPIKQSEEDGSFELTVKSYPPDEKQPGGAMSNFLAMMPIGAVIETRGPTGEISYEGNGVFIIEGVKKTFNAVSLILGGSGITPGYQLIARILGNEEDDTQLRVIDANKTEEDILLQEELNEFAEQHKDQFKIEHVLSHPTDDWKGTKGHVNDDVIKQHCFAPGKDSVVFLCGPPGMITKAAQPALRKLGYEDEKDMFGF